MREEAHDLALDVYKAAADFAREELYGLTSQIRGASMSIPTKISKEYGCDRGAELALGSASELCFILLAHQLNQLSTADFKRHTDDVVQAKQILTSFLQNTESRRVRAEG